MLGVLFQMHSSTVMGHPGKVLVSIGALVREKDHGGVSAERWMLPRVCTCSARCPAIRSPWARNDKSAAIISY